MSYLEGCVGHLLITLCLYPVLQLCTSSCAVLLNGRMADESQIENSLNQTVEVYATSCIGLCHVGPRKTRAHARRCLCPDWRLAQG